MSGYGKKDADLRSQDDLEKQSEKPIAADSSGGADWGRRTTVTLALTVLTSSQGLLIAMSKANNIKYEYSYTSANCTVEFVKCIISFVALTKVWQHQGVTDDNRLQTSWDELKVFPIPAAIYLIKNLLQYVIFLYVDPPSYQILKNLNIISTAILYRLFLKKHLTPVQWSAIALLALGCTIAQMTNASEKVLSAPVIGILLAVLMAFLSGAAGVYTEMIMKKRPQRNVNVQNIYLYVFGIFFNVIAIFIYDRDAVAEKGFFHGYSPIVFVMILNHALSGIAVSMVMKFADNIVKVYSTSVAMILTTLVSIPLFGFQLTLPFVLGTAVVSIAVFLHYQSKAK
mmetsp:Transcript_31783/g.38409  ORF Transcript_31783/g.38409 Transcript_31783/m.38409 type:complete len:341 (+) Transcript_31783:176-1198(+)|eukprot:CAMPEP_0197849068 /NCGR_PEP_ID=MMETSP1438-20131217/10799_1 /TAXON_ID=1461541 /ORGANISM="Pterosperma sp., Strain CCMP1384" /LENGTH=340 /DNA_ID=CAMNT_0043461589 /DNA_START=159 /DNA_END=1181 /DNA_ORIENTATION=+